MTLDINELVHRIKKNSYLPDDSLSDGFTAFRLSDFTRFLSDILNKRLQANRMINSYLPDAKGTYVMPSDVVKRSNVTTTDFEQAFARWAGATSICQVSI